MKSMLCCRPLAVFAFVSLLAACRTTGEKDAGSETMIKDWSPLSSAERTAALDGKVDFRKHVQPILQAKCVACHSGPQAPLGLRFNERASAFATGPNGPRITPRRPEDSSLLKMLQPHTKGQGTMPPVGHQVRPDEAEILQRWIEQGASWPA